MDEKKLRAAGIDYDAALARFVGKRDIYERYLLRFLDDTHENEAEEAFHRQDYQEMLEQTHALKGLAGTLGLTGLYGISAEIVRDLRDEKFEDLDVKMIQMKAEWESIRDAIQNA